MQAINKELKRVEYLEREIEEGIKTIEQQSSFSMALFYGLILGILSSIAASIIYEILLKKLPIITQTLIGIVIVIAFPFFIFLLYKEFNKMKGTKENLHNRLEIIRANKKKL